MADLAYSDYISQFSPDEQPAARDAYFNKYVRPKFSKDELAAARNAFDKHAPLPDPGFFSELGKGLQRGLQTKKQGYLGTAALGATVRGDAEAINQANRDVREQAGVLRKLQSPYSDIENVHSAGDALRWGGAALGESLGQMGPTLGIGLAAGPIGAGADIVATTAGNQYAQALQRADDTTAVNQYLDNQPIDLEKSYESIDKGKLAVGTAASSALEGLGYALGPAGKLIRGTGLLGQAAKAKVLTKGAPADLLAGNVGPTSSRLTNAGIGFVKGGAGEAGTEFGQEFADEYGSGNQDWLSRDTAIQGLKSGANAFLGGGAIHGAAGAMQTPAGATSSPGDNLIRDEFYDAPPEAPVPPTPEEMRATRIENRMADLGTLRSMAPEVFKGLKTKTNKDANPNVVVPLDQFIQHVRKNWKDSVPKVEMNDDLAAQFEEASASNPNLKLNKFVSDLQASLEKQYAKDNPPPTDGEIAKAHALYRELHKAGIRGYGTAEKSIAGDVDLANIEPPVGPVSEGLPSGVGEKNPTVMRNDIQYDGLPAGVAWSNPGSSVADAPDAEAPITEVAPPAEPQSVRELADVVAESTTAGNKGNLAKLRGMSKNFWSALEAEDTDPLAVIDANLEETQANTKIKPETAQLRIDFLNNLKEGVQQWQSQRNPAPAENVNADESAGDLNAENPVITSPPDVGPAKARNRKKPKRAKAQSEALPAAEGPGVADAPDTEGSIGADVPAVTGGAPGAAGGELGAVGAVDGSAGRPAGGGTDAVAGAPDPGNQPAGAAGVATESAPALTPQIADLENAYAEAKQRLDAIGPEPSKPSAEKKAFPGGREKADPAHLAKYDAEVKRYNSWRAKYLKLKKAEVEASNALFRAKKESPASASTLTDQEKGEFAGANIVRKGLGKPPLSVDEWRAGKTPTRAEDKPPTPDEAKALNGVVSTAPPSQRADLSPEEIETLRSQAKAAYTAGDLEIPQYSAVLDFMAKKQWDAVRTILAKLGYTPTTTDKGSLSKVKRAVARGGADIKRLINMLGGQMYKAQLADVTVKEMVQNSFDAVKASVNKKLEKVGKIDVAIDPGNRLVVIRDNGQGMTPAIIQKAFLTLAGTDKSGLNAGEASGGFGMAKAAFLTGSDQIWVRTARDGKQTTFTFKGAGFFEEDIQLDTQEVDKKAHGTTIIVKIPENTKVDGQDYTQWFPYDKSDIEFFKNPMLGNDMEVNFGKFRLWEADPSSLLDPNSPESRLMNDSLETQDLGRNFDLSGYGDPIKATFPWGTADVYFGKKRKTGGWLNRPKHAILSAGIFQFNTNFAEGFDQLPYDIIVNAKPTVAPDSPSYPFNLKREGWKDVIEKDVAALNKYLSNIASGKSAEETVETFKNIRALPRIDVEGSSVGNDVDITEFILQKPKPPVSEAEIEGVLEDQESSAPTEINVGNGLVTTTDKEGKEKTLVDLEQERARKKDKYTSSLETDVPVPKASDFLLDVGIDDKLPIFHNNTGADYSAMSPQADVLFAEIGSLMLTMKDKIASFGRRGYESLKGDQPYFVGVSIDKQYHGVSLVVPFRAALLNPLAIKGKTLPSIAHGLYDTLVHEFTHTRERNHDEAFIGEMSSLHSLLASDGFDIELRVQLARILKKHQQVFNDLRDKFEDSTTTNLSKSLHEGKENGGLASARDEDAISAGRPAADARDTSDAVDRGGERQNGGTIRGNAGGGQQGQDRGGRVPSGAGAVARKVSDAVKDTYGDTLPRSAALVLNPQQLATLNPGLSAAQTYATLIDRMQSMTTQKQQRFKNIVEDIDALPRQVKSELLGVMTESTLADAHPDEEIALSGKNAHLVNNKEAEHLHKLVRARYQALPDNAKKIFKAARDEFAASWTERFDAMRDLVNSFDISERARKKFIAELDRLSNHVKGPYFPLFREGRYSVVWESPAYTAAKESEDHAAMAAMKSVRRSPDFWFRKTDSLEEAKRLASNPPEGMAEGSKGDYNVSDENDVLTQGVTNDFLNQALGEIDKRLAGVDGADEAKQALRETFIRAMPDMSVMKRTLARRNVSGVRADDMLRAIAKAGSADAFYLARIKYAEKVVQSLQALKQQDSKLKHVYGSMLANYRANMVRPDENIFDTAANNLTTWQYYRTLVASPSFIITNSAQPWMVTTPVMAPRFGLGSTIGEMNKALAIGAKVAGATKLGKPSNWSKHEVYTDEMPDPKQPGISNAEASRRQRERQALADLMHRIEISQARELANIGKLGSSTLSKFLRIAATPAHIIETTNRVGTGLAAYRLEFRRLVEDKTRSQRLQDAHRRDYPGTPDLTSEQIQAINHRDAVAYADQMIRETQVDMTPAGMPTIMKKFNRGAMRLLFQFKRYQQAMLFLYARLAADVYRSGDKQAGQALMGLTITHALAAGVKGAALYGLVVKPLGMMGLALKDALDDDEDDDTTFDQYIDALMLKLADGDAKLAQLLRLGLPAYNGVDLSRKVGHGDLFPLLGLPEGDNGDTFEEKLGSYLSDLLPALSSVKSAHDAWHTYQRTGSATDAFNAFGLKPFSDVTRAMSLAEHGMMNRDQTYPYIKADQYSGADLLFKALGFQPTLETEHYRALQAKSSTEDSAKEQKSRLVSAWVRAKRNGDSAALGKVQSDIDAFNQRMPKEMKEFRITVDDRLRALQSAKRKGKQVDELGLSRPRRGGKWIDERTAPYGAR